MQSTRISAGRCHSSPSAGEVGTVGKARFPAISIALSAGRVATVASLPRRAGLHGVQAMDTASHTDLSPPRTLPRTSGCADGERSPGFRCLRTRGQRSVRGKSLLAHARRPLLASESLPYGVCGQCSRSGGGRGTEATTRAVTFASRTSCASGLGCGDQEHVRRRPQWRLDDHLLQSSVQ